MADLTSTLEKIVALLHDSQLVKKESAERKKKTKAALNEDKNKEKKTKVVQRNALGSKENEHVTDMDWDQSTVEYLPLKMRFESERHGRRSDRSYVSRYSPY